jgi:hypothetical protein
MIWIYVCHFLNVYHGFHDAICDDALNDDDDVCQMNQKIALK